MAKILVVDDEPLFRKKLHDILNRDGHEVETAECASEAFQLYEKNVPDLLIVDWMLKNHLNGVDVIQAIRKTSPDLPAIVITGYPSREFSEELAKFDKMSLLSKPFDLEQLKSAVTGALA